MEGQNENDELYPIAVLIDELKVQNSPSSDTCGDDLEAHNLMFTSTMMSFSDSMPFTVYPQSHLPLDPTEPGMSSFPSLMVCYRLPFT
jgi:hypothetical protein